MKTFTARVAHAILAVICCVINCPYASGATISAASVARSDVEAAIAAAKNGDVVRIPAGTAIWTNSIIINRKAVMVIGAGIGNTIITNTQALPNTGEGVAFDVLCTTNGLTRISGIQFDGNKSANVLNLRGDLWAPFRVDNCKFVNVRYRAVAVIGLLAGLIDNCSFVDCAKTADVYGGVHENLSWQLPLTLGTTNTVVMEDCTFHYENWYPFTTGATSSRGQGGRSVMRFCTWTNRYNMGFFPIIDAHGNQLTVTGQSTNEPPGGTGGHRGTRQFEMYGNVFWTDTFPGKSYRLTDLRGGTCLVFSNRFIGAGMDNNFRIREEDGLSAFNYRQTYPGYDGHMLYLWDNTSQNLPITTADFAYPEDRIFILTGINLFWSPMPLFTPLVYPHPLRQLSNRPLTPSNLRSVP